MNAILPMRVSLLQGLLGRPDWQQAAQLPFAMLPTGSGNALSANTGESPRRPCCPQSCLAVPGVVVLWNESWPYCQCSRNLCWKSVLNPTADPELLFTTLGGRSIDCQCISCAPSAYVRTVTYLRINHSMLIAATAISAGHMQSMPMLFYAERLKVPLRTPCPAPCVAQNVCKMNAEHDCVVLGPHPY